MLMLKWCETRKIDTLYIEINAKGVILKAFEQFRLKTCIDFKPWGREPNYIFIFKGEGWVYEYGQTIHFRQKNSSKDYWLNGLLSNKVYTSTGVGFFMHFSTATGTQGDKAYLQSRLFHPKRRSQCLQFYHYNSGGVDDQLNIWPMGNLYLYNLGGLQGSWELYHVTLDVSDKFRVVFEGVKGRKPSKSGLSLDDINLSETKCPQYTWRIRDFTSLLATTPAGSETYSPRFLSPDGYSFQIGLYINGLKDSPNKMAIYFHLTSGPKDNNLQWPCPWRQASMELTDQNPDIQHRMNNIRMITTDPTKTSTDCKLFNGITYFWDNPQKVGSLVIDTDGSKFYRGPGNGTSNYITHDRLKSRSFIKGHDAIFLLSLEGLQFLFNASEILMKYDKSFKFQLHQ
uniref:Meprin A, beta n=1 Tax=Sinocyclocheilus rhinocerous TaxID=307959 RepID=A0A673N607_9TELE